jgi:hypothetical protein
VTVCICMCAGGWVVHLHPCCPDGSVKHLPTAAGHTATGAGHTRIRVRRCVSILHAGFQGYGVEGSGFEVRAAHHMVTTDLRMRGFSLWSWLCVWSGSKWLCCLHVTGKVRCWAYLLLCTQVGHTAGSSLCWGSGVYVPPVGAFLTWCRCQPLEVGNPALLRPVSAAMPDNVSILIGKHPEG